MYIPLGPIQIHPHFSFETLAYLIGFRLYLWLRRRTADPITESTRMWVVVGATVGGLLGGLIGVEWTKKLVGERRSTGDLFVTPLCVGMAIGRIGCFLTGLSDHTHGVAAPAGIERASRRPAMITWRAFERDRGSWELTNC